MELETINTKFGEQKIVRTKYGIITRRCSDFGYGWVSISTDYEGNKILYADCEEMRYWKTVRGFERWIEKQNVINSGVYDKIDTIY